MKKRFTVVLLIFFAVVVLPILALVASDSRVEKTGFACETDYDCGLTAKPEGECCDICGHVEIVSVDETLFRNRWREENCAGSACEPCEEAESPYEEVRCIGGECSGIRRFVD